MSQNSEARTSWDRRLIVRRWVSDYGNIDQWLLATDTCWRYLRVSASCLLDSGSYS
jgi:hypothetical protein